MTMSPGRGAERPADPVAAAEPAPAAPSGGAPVEVPARVRVDLAAHRHSRPVSGARHELADQTPIGEILVRGLVRAQLGLALRLAALVAGTLGLLPLVLTQVPSVARLSIAGLPLAWWLLGVAAFPYLVAVGWIYVRQAEHNEQDFIRLVGRDSDRLPPSPHVGDDDAPFGEGTTPGRTDG